MNPQHTFGALKFLACHVEFDGRLRLDYKLTSESAKQHFSTQGRGYISVNGLM
jgi:hypothetical protein